MDEIRVGEKVKFLVAVTDDNITHRKVYFEGKVKSCSYVDSTAEVIYFNPFVNDIEHRIFKFANLKILNNEK